MSSKTAPTATSHNTESKGVKDGDEKTQKQKLEEFERLVGQCMNVSHSGEYFSMPPQSHVLVAARFESVDVALRRAKSLLKSGKAQGTLFGRHFKAFFPKDITMACGKPEIISTSVKHMEPKLRKIIQQRLEFPVSLIWCIYIATNGVVVHSQHPNESHFNQKAAILKAFGDDPLLVHKWQMEKILQIYISKHPHLTRDQVLATVQDKIGGCYACGRREDVERKQVKLRTCTGCRTVRYCSVKCQKAHWDVEHKALCKSTSVIANAMKKDMAFGVRNK